MFQKKKEGILNTVSQYWIVVILFLLKEPDGSIALPDDWEDEQRVKPKKLNREHYFGAPDPGFSNSFNYDVQKK